MRKSSKRLEGPYVRFRAVYEPRWLVGLRVSHGAAPMVEEGYRKVTADTSIMIT